MYIKIDVRSGGMSERWENIYKFMDNRYYLIMANIHQDYPNISVIIDKEVISELKKRKWYPKFNKDRTLLSISSILHNDTKTLQSYIAGCYKLTNLPNIKLLNKNKHVQDLRKSAFNSIFNRVVGINKLSGKNLGYAIHYIDNGKHRHKVFYQCKNRSLEECKLLADNFYIEKKLELMLA